VTAGQQSDQETIDQPPLSDDDLRHLVPERRGEAGLHDRLHPITPRRSRTGWP
jgi:hypothetical protein